MSGEAKETEAELQVAVRFVIPRGKTEVSVSEALSLGYDQSSEADHGPVWVNEEEVLSLQPSKTVSVYLHLINTYDNNMTVLRMYLLWIRSPDLLSITSQSSNVL